MANLAKKCLVERGVGGGGSGVNCLLPIGVLCRSMDIVKLESFAF